VTCCNRVTHSCRCTHPLLYSRCACIWQSCVTPLQLITCCISTHVQYNSGVIYSISSDSTSSDTKKKEFVSSLRSSSLYGQDAFSSLLMISRYHLINIQPSSLPRPDSLLSIFHVRNLLQPSTIAVVLHEQSIIYRSL